ncbi:MAG: DUF885 domain-containing protein [Proteobacteria bacterium]|nr:DUF885 domain-containing protein [Pseudomonadota bacterium]
MPAEQRLAATAGVRHPALAALLVEHWDWKLREAPVWATTLGDHRFDEELRKHALRDIERRRRDRRRFLAGAKPLWEQLAEGSSDRTTLALLIELLQKEVRAEVCQAHRWTVSAFDNPLKRFGMLSEQHKLTSFERAATLLARYRKIPTSIESTIANLRDGLNDGLVANAESVARTIKMFDAELNKPLAEWALLAPLKRLDTLTSWDAQERARWAEHLQQVVRDEIRPALERYRKMLSEEVTPEARPRGKAGVGALPQGADCYRARIHSYTDLSRTAEELHRLGKKENARIGKAMRRLGAKLFRTRSLKRILERLRTDKELYFKEPEDIVAAARSALARANGALPRYFGLLPKTPCEVRPVPAYEAPYSTIAYYQPPHLDGSKPGEYFINTYKPEVRPRFEMQVLAYHEAVPGHHLQIALGQELGQLPAFRRLLGSTAFVEGWALYTERLADEMGLYSGDLDRMGQLSYAAWRASRLVVDTGLHAMGWTRARAERYMYEHTALTESNISNEVDRYLAWPGQALAYKVGELEIMALRKQARRSLGGRFDIKAFHDVVLGGGAVSLGVLRSQVERWIAGERAKAGVRGRVRSAASRSESKPR